jgi:ribulose-5-phosphate 4-epimerase/fuculose-1-phosphate aldolase
MAPEQDELREELAVCYRIFDQLDWVELISNPITAKVPGA